MTSELLPLTIVIPVKNEEANLAACLETTKGAAKVVVVDSGSTDATAEIARRYGAELLEFRWSGGFPKKRNWLLLNHPPTTEWVLFLDADERITPQVRAVLPEALARKDIAGYWLNYRKHFLGGLLAHGVPQRKLALFRVGSALYERIEDKNWSSLDMEVHEHPIVDGRTEEIEAKLDHLDFKSLHHFIARHNDYSTWEANRYQALISDQDSWKSLTGRQRLKYNSVTNPFFPAAYFFLDYILKLGILDGYRGLCYAKLKSQYFSHIRDKIRANSAARIG